MTAPVALVTGASRGIGKASAVALARAGFDVAVAARTVHEGEGWDVDDAGRRRTLPGSLDATAAEVEAAGRRALPVRLDLLDRASLAAAPQTILDQWGRLDVLVNNAVATDGGSMSHFLDLPVDVLEAKLAANAVAPFALTRVVVPAMLERGGGIVVNVTSAVATSDPPAPAGKGGWGMGYAMSKGAFHRMAGILAVELGDRGIRAFNVDPGYVLTERMEMNQRAHGFESYSGCPPSAIGAVIAWLAAEAGGDAAELNGTTVIAQREALRRGLHPDWREKRR